MPKYPAEDYVTGIIQNRNMLVPHYLINSFLYYRCDTTLISDHLYDHICKRLDAEWDDVEHFHKKYVTRSDLRAGTGHALWYSARMKNAAKALARQFGVRIKANKTSL